MDKEPSSARVLYIHKYGLVTSQPPEYPPSILPPGHESDQKLAELQERGEERQEKRRSEGKKIVAELGLPNPETLLLTLPDLASSANNAYHRAKKKFFPQPLVDRSGG